MSIVLKTVADLAEGEPQQFSKAEKKRGNRIGFNYIVLKSLKESKKNDVVKCFYIKSLISFGICVIKEGTYGDTKDKYGRDIRDRLIWQRQLHQTLQDKVRIPRLLGSFEENGNYYLVIERIKGRALHKLFREAGPALQDSLAKGDKTGLKFLGYLIRIVRILDVMHHHAVVHRDATLNNFMITPGDQVAVIDLELSYSLSTSFPSPPFQLGTVGYMSPEQEAVSVPTVKEDIFAVGAMMLQLWTGISPYKLSAGSREELTAKVYYLVRDRLLAELIMKCMDPEPENRPVAGEVNRSLEIMKFDWTKRAPRQVSPERIFSREEIVDTVQSGIDALGSALLSDPEKGWFAEDMKTPPDEKSKINKAWYASFSRGASGIIYFLAKAKHAGFDVSPVVKPLEYGLDLIREKYIDRPDRHTPGLYFGSDGIAVALSTALRYGLTGLSPAHVQWIDRLSGDISDTLDITKGMAGQGLANLLCARHLPEQEHCDRLNRYVEMLLEKQTEEGSWLHNTERSGGRVVSGFADGVAGITCFLVEAGKRSHDPMVLLAVERGLSWLMTKAVRQHGGLTWKSFSGKALPFSLHDGAPGIVLPFLRAYASMGNSRYRDTAIAGLCGEHNIHVRNSLSQSYGLSGTGEVLLEAASVLKDGQWMERAFRIAHTLCHLKKQKQDRTVYWLTEHERQPVGNFMKGQAGILHFLMRCCFPGDVCFPLLPE